MGAKKRGTEFDLREDTFTIYVAHHDAKGPNYRFDATCEQQPWSWRHLLGSLSKGPRELWESPW